MKKWMSMMLVLVMALMAVGTAGMAESGTYYNEPGTLPIVNEKITLRIISPTHANTEDYNTNELMRYIEEQTNIDIEVITYPLGEFLTKLDLLMAAGGTDTGDIIAMTGTTTLDPAHYNAYGQAGFLIDVTEYLDTLAYWLPRAYDACVSKTYEAAIGDVKSADGKIYGGPFFYSEGRGGNSRDFIQIYKPWLDAAGMKIPTTLEEYRAYLEYVRDNDVDGDGNAANEIPATSYPASTTNINVLAAFVTPFMGVSGHVPYYIDKNDQIAYTYDKDAYREALYWIRDLVADGLLDPNSFTQDKASHDAMTNQDPNILGSFLRFTNSITDAERRNDWVVATSLAKDKDSQRYNAANQTAAEGRWFITSNCKYPEAAFLLGDYLCSQEIALTSNRGWEGVDWVQYDDYTGDKTKLINLIGRPVEECYVTGISERSKTAFNNHKLTMWGASVLGANMKGSSAVASDAADIDWQISTAEAGEIGAKHSTVATTIDLVTFTEEEAQILSDCYTPIKSYMEECYVRFCLNDMDLDTEWDTYLATLEAMGLSQVVEVWNACYARMK
jgi:putative aldouronate transport system substrate-binding protein